MRWPYQGRFAAGHPVYGKVSIAGHTANIPITDLGPAGFTQRAIDITEGGVRKLGFPLGSFPTDAVGTVQILGAAVGLQRIPDRAGDREQIHHLLDDHRAELVLGVGNRAGPR